MHPGGLNEINLSGHKACFRSHSTNGGTIYGKVWQIPSINTSINTPTPAETTNPNQKTIE